MLDYPNERCSYNKFIIFLIPYPKEIAPWLDTTTPESKYNFRDVKFTKCSRHFPKSTTPFFPRMFPLVNSKFKSDKLDRHLSYYPNV